MKNYILNVQAIVGNQQEHRCNQASSVRTRNPSEKLNHV